MSEYTGLDKAVLFHEQECTFSACAGHDARAELAALRAERDALRARVAELEAQAAKDHWHNLYDQLASAVAELHEFEPLEPE